MIPTGRSVSTDGRIRVPGGSVWYEVVGSGAAIPLVTIHGGPGYPHFYLRRLASLSSSRPVVFYDQLGCGNSDRPVSVDLWTVERFVEELRLLLQQLNVPRVHLLGHSWGSIVAAEFCLASAAVVSSLVLASPCLCIPRWAKDAERLIASLSPQAQHALAQAPTSPEHVEATEEYYRRFVLGSTVRPPEVQQSDAAAGASPYLTMWGPNEFTIRGTLEHYDLTPRLKEINIPTLVTCGRQDEATPETSHYIAQCLTRGRLKVFEKSAHLPHVTEAEAYHVTLESFFIDCEASER